MIVIGVTGTNGKSSTVQFIAQLLEALDYKVGYTTTAGFSIAGEVIENRMKMTMPGRFYLQKLLRNMVHAGCQFAVIETSSEGIKQFRHLGINYDVAVFTNLTPEHIESHGSFEKYKQAKGRLFSHLAQSSRKTIDGKKLQKVSVVNIDDPHAEFFAAFPVDDLVTFSWESTDATINGKDLEIPLLATFQKMNATGAVAALIAAGLEKKRVESVLSQLRPIAGRFQSIDCGQDFHVIVDYAYEPYALQALYEAVEKIPHERIIGIHGSAGGGRDVARRPKIGELAARHEDVTIVTNEDPYDEDPREIIEAVAAGAERLGMVRGKDLHLIDEREEAIQFAVSEANRGDIVLITGKGSEPVMAVEGGRKVPWSDEDAAVRALRKEGFHG